MKYIVYSLVLLVTLFASCNDDRNGVNPTGTLYLNVDRDVSMISKSNVIDEALKVYIIDANKDTVKTYNDYLTEVRNAKLILPVGKYTVTVVSNQTEDAGWEKPFYSGSETVEVKSGEITSVKVICKIANTKVSVNYSDGVKDKFINYETTISNGSGSLLFTRDEYRAGFFTPEKLTADLELTNKDGQKFTLRRVFTDVRPRYYYTIMFRIDDKPESDEAGGNFELEVDPDSPDVINCIITITEDALEGKSVPEISLSEAFKENKVSLKEGKEIPPLSLTILSQVGIESLVTKVESDMFTEHQITSFDLCNLNNDLQIQLDAIGFPLLVSGQRNNITLNFDKLSDTMLSRIVGKTKKETHKFTIYAMDALHQEVAVEFSFVVSPALGIQPGEITDADVWATFAMLKGEASQDTGFKFKYGIEGTDEALWQTVEGSMYGTNEEGDLNYFSAFVTGLESHTKYQYRVYAGVGEDEEKAQELGTFETGLVNDDKNPVIPNLSFEDWTTLSYKPILTNVSYLSPNLSGDKIFWDTGNKAASMMGTKNLTSKESQFVHTNNKFAVKLKPEYVGIGGSAGAFAAASIYTGNFVDTDGVGGKINFGQKIEAGFRPTQLSGFYHYTSGVVNYGKDEYLKEGAQDIGSIYVVLCDWDAPCQINTNHPESFIDYSENNKSILAYGKLDIPETTNGNSYVPFTINIEYRDVSKLPSYIVIVASSCKYGDYFVGSTNSILYLDDFSLDFDYHKECFKNTELKDLTPVNK